MTQQIRVTPGGLTRTGAKAGIVVAVLFLLFGLVLSFVILQDMPDSETGLKFLVGAFFFIWAAVCVTLIFIYRRILSKQKASGVNSLVDLDFATTGDAGTGGGGNFDVRLRKLEELKQDGLITEAEYLGKREKILGEHW